MRNEQIYFERIKKFKERLRDRRFTKINDLEVEYIYNAENPSPYTEIENYKFQSIKIGEKWGELWGSAWFKFLGKIPPHYQNQTTGLLIDIQGEGCVFKNGSPHQGLTNKIDWNLKAGKYYVSFNKSDVFILIEAAANGLFGSTSKEFILKKAETVLVNKKIIKLFYDLEILFDLANSLTKNTPRRNKIIYALNEICNKWGDGRNIDKCLQISARMLNYRANNSSPTAYSIGHAHLDLAWLWPIRETRRKAGRTFSTALRLLETYPQYKFGASQAQLFQWVKEDYPQLYSQMKKAINEKKWEIQGAMWVEPDMNIPTGESLIRQCLYGKKFWKEEFGLDIKNLWLPDVFGYSAALPQILKKCNIDVFMTQKISWNETNEFPFNTFYWEGIDGTEILTHFLPTNDYNLANMPSQLIAAANRYKENYISDEFLNLYGIGDGGGGPSREHIEMGIRQQDLEGVPKFKFAFARDFFKKIKKIPQDNLPKWKGELYLELHRGTYTTQALMKKYNRKLELKLRDLEFFNAVFKCDYQNQLEKIWKDTLLNQFHDILPGSSINQVYKDAHSLSKQNLKLLDKIENELQNTQKIEIKSNNKNIIRFFNTQPWERKEIFKIPAESGTYTITDANDKIKTRSTINGLLEFSVKIPSLGFNHIKVESTQSLANNEPIYANSVNKLQNNLLTVSLDSNGVITSIFDKTENREVLSGRANLFELWEDEPNNWGAWDINHFYRETEPRKAKLLESAITYHSDLSTTLFQNFSINNSNIKQEISLQHNSKLIKIKNTVDWQEVHKMLRVSAEPNIHASKSSTEIQFGVLERNNHDNTSWDSAKFEIVGHRFADLSQPDYGFSVLNNCKYGYHVQGKTIDLNLLRSPKDTDKQADLHTHTFTFSYLPHKNELSKSKVIREAHNLNSDIYLSKLENEPKIISKSFLKLDKNDVKIETIKEAEDKNGIIIRLYELYGQTTEVELELGLSNRGISETDMLEKDFLILSEKETDKIKLQFSPFEIRTLRIFS